MNAGQVFRRRRSGIPDWFIKAMADPESASAERFGTARIRPIGTGHRRGRVALPLSARGPAKMAILT